MTIKKLIQTGINGGWCDTRNLDSEIEKIFLDPEFFKAVGREMGWGIKTRIRKRTCSDCEGSGYAVDKKTGDIQDACYSCAGTKLENHKESIRVGKNGKINVWHANMLEMLDTIIEGNKKGTSVTESIIKWVGDL